MDKKEQLLEDLEEGGTVYRPTTNIQDGPLKPDYKEEEEGGSCFLYVSASIVNLLAFSAGVCFSWTSPVIPKLDGSQEPENLPLTQPITSHDASWIAAFLCLGAAFGPLISGKMADKLGRKNSLLTMALPIMLSFMLIAYTSNVKMYFLARFIKGVGVGGSFAVLPMYLGEISEDTNRGTICCLMAVFITFGILYSFVVGPYLTVKMFCFACILPLMLFFFLFYFLVPESPVFLVSKGNRNGAQEALMKLRSKNAQQVQHELSSMVKTVEDASSSSSSSSGGIKQLFSSTGLRKAFFICVGLMLLQQCAGINAVLSYMQTIFDAGGGSIPSSMATILIAIIQILATVATSAVVEKLGRKLLVLVSVIGSTVSLLALGLYFYLQQHQYKVTQLLSFVPVTSLIGYIIFFNFGLGPLPWTIMGELFPANVKSMAVTLNSFICFFASFVITLLFPMLASMLGMALTFWLFAACCTLGTVFVWTTVPETKGKTVAEIQQILSR